MANTVARLLTEAKKYIGFNEDDGSYKTLIDVYNSQDPLPDGYRMTYSDPWCAAGLTAIFILAGMKELIPAECSAERMYEKAQSANCRNLWTTAQAQPGDIIFYDWNKDGTRDHVGIIENVSEAVLNVIECNYKNSVGRRVIHKESPTINGLIRPAYDTEKVQGTYTVKYAQGYSKYFAGFYGIKASDFLNLRTGPGTEYEIMEQIMPDDQVVCYGYFTPDSEKNIWLYVKHIGTGRVGYCAYKYLKYL